MPPTNTLPEQSERALPAVIRVAIIEDEARFRQCLEVLIGGTTGFRCTGAFRSMEVALEKMPVELPDVVLSDIGLPGMSGIEGVKALRERYPDLLVLMLTVYDDDERIFDALCAGACGYLLKKTPPSRLLDEIKEAAAGGSPMTPEVARRVITLFRQIRPPERGCELTPHEVRLLNMLVEGHNYNSAAAELGVTSHTVAFHLQRIYQKLHVHSKTEAVAKALRNRLL